MKILITAGPTREPIDPVRFLSNRSSGKMGLALAEEAAALGHEVTLILGPVAHVPSANPRIRRIDVETAAEMADAVKREFTRHDAAILSAAVADYRPVMVAAQKIKKAADRLTLELERTTDILGSMRGWGFSGCLVGFAAETENVAANTFDKLRRKGCDLLVANDVSRKDIGFESEDNEVLLCHRDGGQEVIPRASKREIARAILQEVERALSNRATEPTT